jgi:hypothetical protein
MELQTRRTLVRSSPFKFWGLFGIVWLAIGLIWGQPFLIAGSITDFLASGSRSAHRWPIAALATLVLAPFSALAFAKVLRHEGTLLSMSGSVLSSPYFRKPLNCKSAHYSLRRGVFGFSEIVVFSDGVEHKVPLILASGSPNANLAQIIKASSSTALAK